MLANLKWGVREYRGRVDASRVYKCAKITPAAECILLVWETTNTVQVIKDVVLECSKSILESTAC